jgi:hypothetical protein
MVSFMRGKRRRVLNCCFIVARLDWMEREKRLAFRINKAKSDGKE